MPFITVVAPVLNEEKNIKELISRLESNLKLLQKEYEIIIIDDGSIDQTWNTLLSCVEKNQYIKAIRLTRNFGQHYAIAAGLHHANGDWVVVMDGDLQDRPEIIPSLVAKALEGNDVVFVSRKNRPESHLYKILQKIFYLLLNILSGLKFDNTQANFSIINRKVVDSYKLFNENVRFYGSVIKWLGYKSVSIEADHGSRFAGKPSYSLKSRFKLASEIILTFSDRPLKFAIFLGLQMTLVSAGVVFWIMYNYFQFGYSVLGWPSLIASIFLVGGILSSLIGVLGIYLGQVFRQVKMRPLYIIDKKFNLG
jgi:dolichol-phosphate mannosyltransferase